MIARTHEELGRAISDKTAMVYTTALGERLEKAVAITKKAGVPMLLDDAAGIPPSRTSLCTRAWAWICTPFSGGKGLAGPQCSGLLLGRKDLIDAALANCCPWEGAVCRAMKVGKEEIMGCLAAVEAWKKKDLNALDRGVDRARQSDRQASRDRGRRHNRHSTFPKAAIGIRHWRCSGIRAPSRSR